MKQTLHIIITTTISTIITIATILPIHAQNTRYETDSTCGCDILYVDGIQTTREGNRYGFKRDDGTVLAPNIYLHVGEFSNGYCRVWLEDSLCGLISASGDYDAESGWVKELFNLGVLRPSDTAESGYIVTNIGTGW